MARTSIRQTSTACRQASDTPVLHLISPQLALQGPTCIRYNQRCFQGAHAQGDAGPVVKCKLTLPLE